MPAALVLGLVLLGWLGVRHLNGRRAPILIGLVVLLLAVGGVVEVRWRTMEGRYTAATRELLDRPDAEVVCERLSAAMFNVRNRAGYVRWTEDGSKPKRANLTWDTCRDVRAWERSGQTAEDLDRVIAVHVLTHEAMHLAGHYGEAEAECLAMQHDSEMAQLLGATPENAEALARSFWVNVYPRMPGDYVSAGCTADGPLDESPGDQLWP